MKVLRLFCLAIILTLLCNPVLPQTTGNALDQLTPEKQQAFQILQSLILKHPHCGVHGQLKRWVADGHVYISFRSGNFPYTMKTYIVDVGRGQRPTLAVNLEFLMRLDGRNDWEYKELVIFHEYVHIRDHLDEKFSLQPINADDPETIIRWAESIWEGEFAASHAEWEFARSLGRERLLPIISKAIEEFGEDRGFLEGFYQILTGFPWQAPRPDIFLSTWEEIYQKKKQGLEPR